MSNQRENGASRGVLARSLAGVGWLLLAVLIALLAVCLTTHPFDTPLRHQYGQTLHGLVWAACGTPPGNEWGSYTGVARLWNDRGGLLQREQYQDGERCGVWVRYHEDGSIERVYEYRDDAPWNGVCNVTHGKAFLLEYRSGKAWNGADWRFESASWVYFIDGEEVTADAFRAYHKLSGVPEEDLHWYPRYTEAQLTKPQGVMLPQD